LDNNDALNRSAGKKVEEEKINRLEKIIKEMNENEIKNKDENDLRERIKNE
jgi:hypothetical protein